MQRYNSFDELTRWHYRCVQISSRTPAWQPLHRYVGADNRQRYGLWRSETQARESGRIPLSAALAIVGAGSNNEAVQAALQEAYESGLLRGKQLIQARRIIEKRQTFGRALGPLASAGGTDRQSAWASR